MRTPSTPSWRRYLTFWRGDIARDVNDELRFHTEMRVDEFMARGMTEAEARRAVAERLGDVDAAKAECIDWGLVRETHARRASVIDGLLSDVRYALRALARTPGWTAIALLTIALGVGATTTVFSVADSLIVRTFPYPNASRVFIAQRQFTINGDVVAVSLPFGMSTVWREKARTIEDAVLAGGGFPELFGSGADTLTANVSFVEPGFIAFAGAHLVIGRVPKQDELTPSTHLMFITEQFWRRQYAASPDVIGKTVKVRGDDWTIVGVVPASLTVPNFRAPRSDVLAIAAPDQQVNSAVLVRLKPGVSREAATAELEAIMQHADLQDVRAVPMPMPLRLKKPEDWLAIRRPLVMLTGAVALLLLVACTNVAHLLLARGAARQRELAVRHALGAGRSRLIRQLVTESVVLAIIGGALAAIVGWAGLHLLMALKPDDREFNALTYVSTNHAVLSIASALAILAGVAIGVIAALRSAHRDVAVALRIGAASSAHTARRLRSLLVVGEVALSAMLLVGALLLVHALFSLEHESLGFDARGLYGIEMRLPRGMAPAARDAFAAEARDRIAAMPGVSDAIVSGRVPGGRGFTFIGAWETPDHPRDTRESDGGFDDYAVTARYFSMLHMRLLAGRTFDEGSYERNEIIVSQSFANVVSPGRSPLGLRVRNATARTRSGIHVIPGQKPAPPAPDEPWKTIIGVVPDVVTSFGQHPVTGMFYHPLAPQGSTSPAGFGLPRATVIVRIAHPSALGRVSAFASALAPNGGSATVTNVRETIDATLAEPMFVMRLLVAFAALGVVLAAIGLFGVISYSVSQRTREIGVRMTLGATRGSIARLVVGDGVRLALAGIVLGLGGALVATRLIASVLFGVSRFDPFSLGAGAALLLAVAVIACVAPMLRATAIDPAIAVRAE